MAGEDVVRVLAAVIERDGCVLVTRRLEGTHLSGMWEFPGGKCEAGETDEQCLARELLEELGLVAAVGPEILVVEHAYPERRVRLHFRSCTAQGEPRAVLGQDMRWIPRGELQALEFPDADAELIRYLTSARS